VLTTLFNWILALNIGLNLYNTPGKLFIVVSLSLLVIEVAHFSIRLVNNNGVSNTFYMDLQPADVYRMAAALIGLNWATGNISYFASVVLMVVTFLLFILTIYIIAINTFSLHSRNKTVLVIGAFCLFTLGGWFKSAYIIHHGAKEMGHWLEMPDYVTNVPATVSAYVCQTDLVTCALSHKQEELAVAKVYISNTTSWDDAAYDGGMEKVNERSIIVISFTTNNNQTYDFSGYRGELTMGTSGIIDDDQGRSWSISIGRGR